MSFNLNNQVDFARATLSVAANPILQAATVLDALRGKNKWQIDEAAYIATTNEKDLANNPPNRFHVFRKSDFNAGLKTATVEGGQRRSIFKFPYVDGWTSDGMGLDGDTHTYECIFHGPNYLVGWNQLLKQLRDPRTGTLTHPAFGKIQAVPKSWRITMQSDTRFALIATLTFIEQNFSISEITQVTPDKSVKGALSKALAATAAFSNAITKVQATVSVINTVKSDIQAAITQLQTGFRGNLLKLNLTFNNSGSIDIPGAMPVQSGGLTDAQGNAIADSVSTITSPNDPFQGTLATGPELSQSAPLTTTQAVDLANQYRDSLNLLLNKYADNGLDLEMYDDILALRTTAILIQEIVEAGVQSSQPRVIDYTTPRVMSLREVAFANGLTPDDMAQLDQLNPSLDSVNFIEAGTILQVPTAS